MKTTTALKDVERRLSEMALLIKNIEMYKEFRPIYNEYKKSRDKEKYLRGHEREIILFETCAKELKAAGVTGKLPNVSKLKEDHTRLTGEKDKLYLDYYSLKKRLKEYDAVKRNVDSILSPFRVKEQDRSL